jgi:pimeloyl-ACP methyl ester carboxylesterase
LVWAPSDGSREAERLLLFEAEKGGELLSWDADPGLSRVGVVHRRANAMLAEVILVEGPFLASAPKELEGPREKRPRRKPPQRVVAIDGRVEYCKPQLAFLADGRLVARLNLTHDLNVNANSPMPPPVVHGLWVFDDGWEPIQVCPERPHGSYDVFSGTYGSGNLGEGFLLDHNRQTLVVTARGHSFDTVADELWAVVIEKGVFVAQRIAPGNASQPKGCHIPVAISGKKIVYNHRSPTEWGDLWSMDIGSTGPTEATRLTYTMPLSLQQKLRAPEEVVVPNPASGRNFHALLYHPTAPAPAAEKEQPALQALVWVHGGPCTMYAYDYNPLLNWLAGLGYLVCVPNFTGSVGFGVGFMDAVLRDGCGVADLSDCVACAGYLRSWSSQGDAAARLDLSRGVGVAGHSWGGYLALLAMVQNDSPFSCGVASAGISDWKVQQAGTEVRYFDYALMGGWVYEAAIAERAARASPVTYAANLRAPLLVLHGEADRDVPFEQIGPFVEAAKRSVHSGAKVTYVTYPGDGHGMRNWGGVGSDPMQRIRDFLRVNLKPWDFTDNPHGDLTTY